MPAIVAISCDVLDFSEVGILLLDFLTMTGEWHSLVSHLRVATLRLLVRLVVSLRWWRVLVDRDEPVVLEVLHVFVKAVEAAHLCVLDVPWQVDVGLDGLVPSHHDDVEREAEDEVASEVVQEHVVSHLDLVLRGEEVEQCDDWSRVHQAASALT